MVTVMRSSPDVLRFQGVSPYIHVYGLASKFSTAVKGDSPTHPMAPSKSNQPYQHTPLVAPTDLLLMPFQNRKSGFVQKDMALDVYTIKHRSRSGTRAIGCFIRRRIIGELGLMPIFLFGEWDGSSISYTERPISHPSQYP